MKDTKRIKNNPENKFKGKKEILMKENNSGNKFKEKNLKKMKEEFLHKIKNVNVKKAKKMKKVKKIKK